MELEDIVTVSRSDMTSVVASTTLDQIEKLENHIDVLHTKLSAAEDRIAILESIVLKTV